MDDSTYLPLAAEYLDVCQTQCARLVALQSAAYDSLRGASLGDWAGIAADYARHELLRRVSDLEQIGDEARSIYAHVCDCEAVARLALAGVG